MTVCETCLPGGSRDTQLTDHDFGELRLGGDRKVLPPLCIKPCMTCTLSDSTLTLTYILCVYTEVGRRLVVAFHRDT